MIPVRITGCGVSAVCTTLDSVTYWLAEIIYRGGVPMVTAFVEDSNEN